MIRRHLLEALDLCAVPVTALALVIASTQNGAPGRERNLDRKAGAAADREVMIRLTDLPYGDAQDASTMPDARGARNGLNPRQAPPPTAPDFRF
jgi:hypothetical protein